MQTQKTIRPKPRTKRDMSVSTKEQILLAAEELFAQKGFEGTRTRDIADHVGVNISTLHFHWTSKEELHAGVYQHVIAERAKLTEELFALLEPLPTTQEEWVAVVKTTVDKTFAFFRAHPFAARLSTYQHLNPTDMSANTDGHSPGHGRDGLHRIGKPQD